MKFQRVIIYCFFLFFTVSCADDQCNLETDALLKTEFVIKDQNLISINFLDSLSVFSPEWTDSIHYWKEKDGINLLYSLSPAEDFSEIIITSKKASLNDTLFIYYQREFLMLSPECGFVVNYTIDSVLSTSNYIDSLFIITPAINTLKNGHIQIYF